MQINFRRIWSIFQC